MKEATKYANKIAQKENDDALEAGQEVGQDRDHRADPAEKARPEEGACSRCTRRWSRASARRSIDAVYKETGFDPAKL